MQTSNFKSRRQQDPLLRRIVKQASIDRMADHFQGAFMCLDQFGLCVGLSMSLFLLISLVLQAAHSGAQKGVI